MLAPVFAVGGVMLVLAGALKSARAAALRVMAPRLVVTEVAVFNWFTTWLAPWLSVVLAKVCELTVAALPLKVRAPLPLIWARFPAAFTPLKDSVAVLAMGSV